jgi:hypothetical protein
VSELFDSIRLLLLSSMLAVVSSVLESFVEKPNGNNQFGVARKPT